MGEGACILYKSIMVKYYILLSTLGLNSFFNFF